MTNDAIERILVDEETLTPSAGFLASVMRAVQREAAVSPPLGFPWLRALPGVLAAVAAQGVLIWHGIGGLSEPASIAVFGAEIRQLMALATGTGIHWILLAAAIPFLSLVLAVSLTGVSHDR